MMSAPFEVIEIEVACPECGEDFTPSYVDRELAALRARVVELEAAVSEAHLVMVKIGNDLNWDAPADEQLADAINACRACGIAQPAPEEVTP